MYHLTIQNSRISEQNYTEVSFDILHQLEEKISTWDKMKRVMSWVRIFCVGMKAHVHKYQLALWIFRKLIKISFCNNSLNISF